VETQKDHIGGGDGIPLESVEAGSAPVFIWEAEPVVGERILFRTAARMRVAISAVALSSTKEAL
jgi:hypothetical protein